MPREWPLVPRGTWAQGYPHGWWGYVLRRLRLRRRRRGPYAAYAYAAVDAPTPTPPTPTPPATPTPTPPTPTPPETPTPTPPETPTPTGVPQQVVMPRSVTTSTTNSITFSWVTPGSGESVLVDYQLEYMEVGIDGATAFTNNIAPQAGATQSYTITGLERPAPREQAP